MSKIRRRLSVLVLSFMLGLLVMGVFSIRPVEAFTSSNADTAMSAFVNTFWNPTKKYFYTNSDHQIHTHASGPESGLYTDFWWEAQLWEAVMDAYQRTNSATYRQMIDDVYDGFAAYYPTFSNNFNDDQGWWALASARAYEITGSTRYKDRAIALFNTIYAESDSTYGGGIWWRKSPHDQKNAATNGPAIITAVKLKNATGDNTYLTKAQTLYTWLKSNLSDGAGHLYDHIDGTGVTKWDFSYNFGVFIGAANALYGATNTASYLTDAVNAANWATGKMTNGGTLIYEGVDDGGGFKMIFARYLNRLVIDRGQTQFTSFLQNNATQAWNHRRTSDNLMGPDWSAPAPSGYIQSLTAAAGVSIMQFVSPDGVTGILAENGTYEAENAITTNVNSESTSTGYTGRGYLAGWNSNGQSVKFNINVGTAGTYQLSFRYAGGAGNASRKVVVNGSTASANLSFTGTGSWSSWNTVNLNNISLSAGYNWVSVEFDSASGSSNWLNLDKMQLTGSSGSTTYQAENGTLHSLSSEATYSGYHGTGYLAGWNANGQWVDISVNVSSAGNYTLTLRYAAGAGNASRYIYVNSAGVVNNQSFTGTGSWSTWNTVTISGVGLNAGSNTVSVIFNSSLGSTNWLNLDEITIS